MLVQWQTQWNVLVMNLHVGGWGGGAGREDTFLSYLLNKFYAQYAELTNDVNAKKLILHINIAKQ